MYPGNGKWFKTRTAILVLHACGKTLTEIANNLGYSRGQVYRTIQRGSAEPYQKKVPKTAWTPELIAAVSDTLDENNGLTTINSLVRNFGQDRRTMKRLVNDDLGLYSFKRTPRQALKPTDREKRLSRPKKLLSKVKHKPKNVVIIFDETPFQLGKIVANDTGFYLAEGCGAAHDDVKRISKERHYANI